MKPTKQFYIRQIKNCFFEKSLEIMEAINELIIKIMIDVLRLLLIFGGKK